MRVPSSLIQFGLSGCCFLGLVSCSSNVSPGVMSPTERVLSVLDFGSVTSVRDIQKNKQFFSVHVKGKIAAQAPLGIGVKAYELKDETGSIWIVTQNEIPSTGTSVVVKGTVRHKKILVDGQDQSGVYLEQNGTAETIPAS
jgi:hypothetical protein